MQRTATNEELRSALSDLLDAVESGVLHEDELPEPFAEPAEAARRALYGVPDGYSVRQWMRMQREAPSEPAPVLPDETAIEAWLRSQMESGCLLSEDLPRLMARYALCDPHQMREEFAERMGMDEDARAT